MIYALVEPSIYMIASILPTTRHLYRRLHRKARRAAQLRSSQSGGSHKNSTGFSEPAELERMNNSNASDNGITRRVDIWQADAHSSQEELTLGEWYRSQQDWNPSKPQSNISSKRPAPQPSTNDGTAKT